MDLGQATILLYVWKQANSDSIFTFLLQHKYNYNEKALRETQTLRAGCSKAEPKIFDSPQTPFFRGRRTAKI